MPVQAGRCPFSRQRRNVFAAIVAIVTLFGAAGYAIAAGRQPVGCLPGSSVAAPTLAMNVGGPEVIVGGKTWLADRYGTGGHVWTSSTNTEVTNTDLDPLFRTERAAKHLSYTIPVENGNYLVRLYVAEIYWNAPGGVGPDALPGKRVESFIIEGGHPEVVSINPTVATGGVLKAHTLGYTTTITDGTLTIVGTGHTDFAALQALEVLQIFPCVSKGTTPNTSTSPLSTPKPSSTTPTPESSDWSSAQPTVPSEATSNSDLGAAGVPRPGKGPLSTTLLPGRQVWGHMVPHGLPDYSNWAPNSSYGTGYPLDMVKGDHSATRRATSGVPRAQMAGFTGMQLLQFDWVNKGSDFVTGWMRQADPTWADSDPDNNFSVAPCLYVKQPGSVRRVVAEYSAAAQGHPSAARVNGKLVVWVYAMRKLSAQGWQQARAELRAAGLDVLLIGDLNVDASQHGNRFDPALVRDYLPHFDASWLFDDSTSRFWPDLQSYLAAQHQPFAGGTMPGYNRETSANGGYISPRGTKMLREQWQAQLDSGAPWATLVTWNDAVEHSEIKANADWNTTRQAVNAFYSAKHRGLAYPQPSAQLFVTTPDFIRRGQSVQAEALVLNGSAQSVQVHVKLVDGQGSDVGSVTSTPVGSGQAGDATTASAATVNTLPSGRFLRAQAWTTDSNGTVLQRVTSAPILVYEPGVQATPMMRQHFYSIPAAHALPESVRLQLNGSPTSSSGAQAVASVSPATDVRFIEVIQNTRQVDLGFDSSRFAAKVPMGTRSIVGMKVSATPNGFYVARVIDEQERVGYSDPIYVP